MCHSAQLEHQESPRLHQEGSGSLSGSLLSNGFWYLRSSEKPLESFLKEQLNWTRSLVHTEHFALHYQWREGHRCYHETRQPIGSLEDRSRRDATCRSIQAPL